MRLFSTEAFLLAGLLTFAALLFWVLFGRGAKFVGERAAVVIIAGVVLVLLVLVGFLHFW